MATHGSLFEYYSAKDWVSHVKRMDQCFLASDVNEAQKKRIILLSIIEDKTYKLIQDLVAPDKPTDTYVSCIKSSWIF